MQIGESVPLARATRDKCQYSEEKSRLSKATGHLKNKVSTLKNITRMGIIFLHNNKYKYLLITY